MLDYIKDWKGAVEYNDTVYPTADAFILANKRILPPYHIILHPAVEKSDYDKNTTFTEHDNNADTEYRITVKKYMTQKASPEFDFMAKWNNDNPMPLRIMTGRKIKETKGMVYMELHGDMYAEKMCTCMKCGKKLTNKVSQYFGIGPECGGHNYVNPFNTEEELKQAVAEYRKKLVSTTWTGWVIRSSIIKEEKVG